MKPFMKAHRSTIVVALVSIAVATVLGLIASVNHFRMMADEGSPMPWRHAAVMEMPFWYAAAALTPALAWALRSFPDRARGVGRAVEHVAIAMAWIVVQAVLDMAARDALGTGLSGSPPSYGQTVHDALVGGFLARLLTYGAIVGVIYALTYYTRYRERDLAASQLEARLAEAQLRMLRMQLNPHFLFNAMNTVAMLTRAGRSPLPALRSFAFLRHWPHRRRHRRADLDSDPVHEKRELSYDFAAG